MSNTETISESPDVVSSETTSGSETPRREKRAANPARSLGLFMALAAAAVVWGPSRSLALTIGVLLTLIALHEAGHFLAAKLCRVGTSEFSIGFGPLIVGTSPKPGRTRLVLRSIPLGGYVRIKGMGETGAEKVDEGVPGKSFSEASSPQQMFIAAAGPLANILVAAVILVGVFMFSSFPSPTTVVEPDVGSPAAEAGMVAGDRIVAVGSSDIAVWDDVRPALDGVSLPYEVTVDRGGELLTLTVVRSASDDEVLLGVLMVPDDSRVGPVEAVRLGASGTWQMFTQSLAAFAMLPGVVADIPNQVTGTSENPDNRFVSPIGMASLAEQSSEAAGLAGLAILVAFVSMFLALFNLLPIPPLDGGHILVAAYEGVASTVMRRRVRVNRVLVSRVAIVVFAVVITIGVTSIVLDIFRPPTLPM